MAGKKRIKRKKASNPIYSKIMLMLSILGVTAVIGGAVFYKAVYGSNLDLREQDTAYFYIKSTDDYQDIVNNFQISGYVKNQFSLEWVMERKNYRSNIIPGKYKLEDGMSNNDIVNMLRSGRQEMVLLTLNLENDVPSIAGRLAENLEVDSVEFLQAVMSSTFLKEHDLNKNNVLGIFVANTYEFYWATPVDRCIERFWREYEAYWNADRKSLAKAKGLSPLQVTTLASIVFKETVKIKDAPKIAGVYLNRLRIGMPLQADPTLLYALKDNSIRRVLNIHKEVDSPYNTYKNRGLPPGPIAMASAKYIDAVLNAEKHNYLYFCAKEDFSGYSNFSATYDQHLANARKYQAALNKRKIYS